MKYLNKAPIPFAMPDTTAIFGKQTCNECENAKCRKITIKPSKDETVSPHDYYKPFCSKGRNMEKYKDGVVKCFEFERKRNNSQRIGVELNAEKGLI